MFNLFLHKLKKTTQKIVLRFFPGDTYPHNGLSLSLVYLAMTYFPRSYAPSILGPGTKGTIVSSGHYRRATHPKGILRGEGELIATLRPETNSPAVWIVEPRTIIAYKNL